MLSNSDIQRKQKLLEECIMEIAEYPFPDPIVEPELSAMASKFIDVYSDGFRHNYSKFFSTIQKIYEAGKIDYLSENISILSQEIAKDLENGRNVFNNIHQNLVKLCDHLSLELSRFIFYTDHDKKLYTLEAKIKQTNEALDSAQEDLVKFKKATGALEEATKKASSMQTEIVAVLSIFSAIVIAFFGGISFLGNALSGMSNTSIYKTVFIVLVCGIVLSNTIFLLLYLVGKIIDRNIYARCESDYCTCGPNSTPKCSPAKRLQKRLPYIFYLNILILSLMFLDVVIWAIDKSNTVQIIFTSLNNKQDDIVLFINILKKLLSL